MHESSLDVSALTVVEASGFSYFSTPFFSKFCSKGLQMVPFARKSSRKHISEFRTPVGPWVPNWSFLADFQKCRLTRFFFCTLADWIWLILHIMVELSVLSHVTTSAYMNYGTKLFKTGPNCYTKKGVNLYFITSFRFECLNVLNDDDGTYCSSVLPNNYFLYL